jgi:hypothetical protein
MAELWEEEFDVLVGELSQLVAEDIVNAHMVGIAATGKELSISDLGSSRGLRCSSLGGATGGGLDMERGGRS